MEIRVIAATTRERTNDGFTYSDICKLYKTALGKPIFKDFNLQHKVGRVLEATIVAAEDNIITISEYLLELVVELDDFEISNQYIVPGYTINETGLVIEARCFGLVAHAADKTLPSITVKYKTKQGITK